MKKKKRRVIDDNAKEMTRRIEQGDVSVDSERMSRSELEKFGYTIQLPRENEVFIDIDTEAQYKLFKMLYERALYEMPMMIMSNTPSRSGLPHRHIVIAMADKNKILSDYERIAIQAALGSDPVKELISLIDCQHGDTDPVLFIKDVPKSMNESWDNEDLTIGSLDE